MVAWKKQMKSHYWGDASGGEKWLEGGLDDGEDALENVLLKWPLLR